MQRLSGVSASDFLNNRHYDPTTGTFTSVDPLVTSTMQPYIYGAANPVTYSDPSGLCVDMGNSNAVGSCNAFYRSVSGPLGCQIACGSGQSGWDRFLTGVGMGFAQVVAAPFAIADDPGAAWEAARDVATTNPVETASEVIGGRVGDLGGFGECVGSALQVGRLLKQLLAKGGPSVAAARAAATELADSRLADGRGSGAAGALSTTDGVFVASSGRPGPRNQQVRLAYGDPSASSPPWHGFCAEVYCLSDALDAGVDPRGGVMVTVNIGNSGRGHGTTKPACISCRTVLDRFGVTYE